MSFILVDLLYNLLIKQFHSPAYFRTVMERRPGANSVLLVTPSLSLVDVEFHE
jgi:hypothetical protein